MAGRKEIWLCVKVFGPFGSQIPAGVVWSPLQVRALPGSLGCLIQFVNEANKLYCSLVLQSRQEVQGEAMPLNMAILELEVQCVLSRVPGPTWEGQQ